MWDPTTVPSLTQCYALGFPRLFKKGWVPHFRKHFLKPGSSKMGRGRCWRLWATRGRFSTLWVEKVPAGAQSVLTCVTWASAVWLVDWMNIVWVSSCPAGIVTGWIWYNCCKIKRQWRRKFRIWTNVGWRVVTIPWCHNTNRDEVANGYLSIRKLVELLLSLLYLRLCDLKRRWIEHCKKKVLPSLC